MTLTRLLQAALVCAALVACGDDGGPGTPGTLVVSVITPNSGDAGMLLTVTGPGVDAVSVTSSSQVVYWRLTAANEARILVLGNFSSGPLVKIDVPKVGDASKYSATVLDVTDRDNNVRGALDGYGVTVKIEGQ
jgi:hypothetical protein